MSFQNKQKEQDNCCKPEANQPCGCSNAAASAQEETRACCTGNDQPKCC